MLVTPDPDEPLSRAVGVTFNTLSYTEDNDAMTTKTYYKNRGQRFATWEEFYAYQNGDPNDVPLEDAATVEAEDPRATQDGPEPIMASQTAKDTSANPPTGLRHLTPAEEALRPQRHSKRWWQN